MKTILILLVTAVTLSAATSVYFQLDRDIVKVVKEGGSMDGGGRPS